MSVMPVFFRHSLALVLPLFLSTCCQAQKLQLSTCDTIQATSKTKLNSGTSIELLKSVVFDTTATLLNCQLMDAKTLSPLVGATIQISNTSRSIVKRTDKKGEFEIFTNLEPGEWNLKVEMPGYQCLYVINIIQRGGQWYKIMLSHK